MHKLMPHRQAHLNAGAIVEDHGPAKSHGVCPADQRPPNGCSMLKMSILDVARIFHRANGRRTQGGVVEGIVTHTNWFTRVIARCSIFISPQFIVIIYRSSLLFFNFSQILAPFTNIFLRIPRKSIHHHWAIQISKDGPPCMLEIVAIMKPMGHGPHGRWKSCFSSGVLLVSATSCLKELAALSLHAWHTDDDNECTSSNGSFSHYPACWYHQCAHDDGGFAGTSILVSLVQKAFDPTW